MKTFVKIIAILGAIAIIGMAILAVFIVKMEEADGNDNAREELTQAIENDLGIEHNTKTTESVLYEDEYLKITSTGFTEDFKDNYDFNYTIENKSDTDMVVDCKALVIDGYTVDMWLYDKVTGGTKTSDSAWIQDTNVNPTEKGTHELTFKFEAWNSDNYMESYEFTFDNTITIK